MSTSTCSELLTIDNPSILPLQFGRTFSEWASGFMVEVFLYGINIVLFSAATFVLVRKGKGIKRWPLLASAATMFSISTANVSLSMYMLFGLLAHGTPLPRPMIKSKHMFYVINNIIADVLLISRCYAVWSRSLCVIAVPAAFLLASSIYGLVLMSGPAMETGKRRYMYMWLTLSLNISVTALTAVRVWWIARQASKALGIGLARKYYSAMAIIIESGAIYSLYVFVDQMLLLFKRQSFILDAGLAQIVAIAPTLIIVQVGLGRHIRDVETTIQAARGASMVLSTVHSDSTVESGTNCHNAPMAASR